MRKLGLVLVLTLVGCGKPLYEAGPGGTGGSSGGTTGAQMQPVVITGTRHAYDVMFVVDRSGSMADGTDGTAGVCQNPGQQNLPCKWDELLSLMTGDGGFIASLDTQLTAISGSPPRFGLVTFGGFDSSQPATVENSCSPGVVQRGLTPVDSSVVQDLSNKLLALGPNGATATAASMQVAGDAFLTDGADRFAILLTDGAPNCNPRFQATAANCSNDRCVSNGACYGQTYSPYGCLDEDNSVAAVKTLHDSKAITTFVIGFGADFNDSASPTNETLERMAQAGGAPRTDATGTPLEPAFYRASDATALAQAFSAVGQQVQGRCTFQLASAAPASFSRVELTAGSALASVVPSNLFLSGDRLTAIVADPTACTTVTGTAVTFTFQ